MVVVPVLIVVVPKDVASIRFAFVVCYATMGYWPRPIPII